MPARAPASTERDTTQGMLLGALGVVIFAATLPMTRLAVGDQGAPQLPPGFVTVGRAAVAGLLSLAYLALQRAPTPARRHWPALLVSALGTVLGFPLFLALALRQVEAMHAAVITGVLPLATAAVAAAVLRQRASPGFWLCALLGCGLVVGYAAWQGSGAPGLPDLLLLLAVLSAAVGYVGGAQVALALPAPQVICWVLVLSLPAVLPLAWWLRPAQPASLAAWGGFVYVSLFSMWLGFFAWYRALALGGVMRVSQVQLLQPFVALLLAVPLLGERLDAATLAFALAVLAVVFVGRRMPVHAR
ncbi:MAG: DMT family transporter [Rubrivivax sp.]|jgi:drug/metabolite transporter (DMT)-like permease|nr:DMT family transporter [Rubrivivax sp.]